MLDLSRMGRFQEGLVFWHQAKCWGQTERIDIVTSTVLDVYVVSLCACI